MYYLASKLGSINKTERMKVSFSGEEWKQIYSAERKVMIRTGLASGFLGILGCLTAIFGGMHGWGKWIILAVGVLLFLMAFPAKNVNGLNSKGEIVDRILLDKYIFRKLEKYPDKNQKVYSIKALEDQQTLTEDQDTDSINIPLSFFLPEEMPASSQKWMIAILITGIIDCIWFLIWRINVVGRFVNGTGVVVCVISALLLIGGWGMGETKANRTAVLVACIMLSFIGGAMIYTKAALIPAALQTMYSRENAGERKGLQRGVVILKEQEDELNTIYLQPWGSKDKIIVAFVGRDTVVDSAFYGNSKKAKGFAYGCSIELYDGTTGDSLGTMSVTSVLPPYVTSYGPTSTNFELHPSEREIIREVKNWIKQ